MNVMTLLFGQYTFSCMFTKDAILPEFKGSTFRGVFGRALKNTVCALKHQECAACLLKEKCLYCVTFETRLLQKKEDLKVPGMPHPFVINPPLSTQTQYPKGSAFELDLLLFGKTNDSLPYFIYAFDQMGQIGIGKKINGARGTFRLHQVRQEDDIIFNHADDSLKANNPDNLSLKPNNHSHADDTLTVKLSLITPLRLKFNNRLHDALPFHILVRAMLRRASALFDCHGSASPDFDYPGMVDRANNVKTIASAIRWFDWRRYSFRQKDEMLMGGMTGSVTYEGKLNEYLPLIEFCEKVNIGKQTAFGLGKIKLES